jgi:hypothetical protein
LRSCGKGLEAGEKFFFRLYVAQLNGGSRNRTTIIALLVLFWGASSLLMAGQVVAVNDLIFERARL